MGILLPWLLENKLRTLEPVAGYGGVWWGMVGYSAMKTRGLPKILHQMSSHFELQSEFITKNLKQKEQFDEFQLFGFGD